MLLGGVLVVSTASILIRYAHAEGASSIAIAALRLAFATVLLTPFAWPKVRSAAPVLDRKARLLSVGAGLALGIHFAAWISSLEYTSVASSAVLVTTNPIWVGLASAIFLRERLAPLAWLGVALSLMGGIAVFLAQQSNSAAASNPLLGNSLALIGALAASAYLLIGRGLRDRLPLLAYVWLVYGIAAGLLLLTAVALSTPLWSLSWIALAAIFGLAAGPQLLGHTAFNWAIRHVSAPLVAIAILGEPVGSAILAWILFGETVNDMQLAGFALLLMGIFGAALAEQKTKPQVE